MDFLKNIRQLYFCCGCSLRIGCILIAFFELCYPIGAVCSPVQESDTVIGVCFLLYISASILLLYGTLAESTAILFSWIIYRAVVMFLTFVGLIFKLHEINQKYEEKTKITIFFCISMIFYFSINSYFWTIVYSYHAEMKEKQRRQSATLPTIQKY